MGREVERFKALVLFTIALTVFIQFLYFSGAPFSVESEAAKQWQGYGAVASYAASNALYYSWLLFHVAGLIGMFFFLVAF